MPTKHRDFRKSRRTREGPWGFMRFLLFLGVLGLASFAVGALVISRMVLPKPPALPRSPDGAATESRKPSAQTAPTTSAAEEPDTVVEQVTPGSSGQSTVRRDPVSPPPAVTQPTPSADRDEGRDRSSDDARPRVRRPERRSDPPSAERRPERRPDPPRTERRRPDPDPRPRENVTRPPQRRDRPTASRPVERPERRNSGGVQRSETIDD